MARNVAIWFSAIAITIFGMAVAMPWVARNGYAGSVIEKNYESGRDASGIFYTDVPNMRELQSRFEVDP
ncbi:MAG: hypothetical protein AMXMBFR84_01390 [Candidatus Hydrogenedentota bacterium]